MSRHSLFAAATLFFIFTHRIEASTPLEAFQPTSLSMVNSRPDTAGNPEFRNANLRYPGKSLLNAYGWMLLSTVIPLAAATAIPVDGTSGDAAAVTKSLLFLGGFTIGPSAGQIYAGSYGRGAFAFAVRTAGFAMLFHGLGRSPQFCDGCDDSSEFSAGAWMVSGFLVYVGGVVYSMYDQEKAVERYNEKLRGDGAFGWIPTLEPGRDGSLRTGATAWMRF
ncbi:MAG: hypothetical protein ABIW76_12225 [Fibrobacteria bacterium]